MIRRLQILSALFAATVLTAVAGAGSAGAQTAAVPYPPSSGAALSASAYDPCAGASNILGGTGFQAAETVSVVLLGSGQLGRPVAAADGSFELTVTIPIDARGAQRVTATGLTSGRSASVALDVPCVLGQNAASTSGGGTSAGGLASTGVAVGGALLLAAVLVGSGAVMVVAARRRRGLAR